jgi:ribose 5-phosphate isomerase
MADKSNTPGPTITDMDREIFELHNNLRQDPKKLVEPLKEMLGQFDGMLLKRPGKVTLRTKEGADAVKEAIEFLEQQTSI